MAHIEKPRFNKTTNDWSVRVTYYTSGHKRHLSLTGYASAREARTAADHEANQLERDKFLGELAQSPDPLEVGQAMTGGELVEHWNQHYVQVYLTGSTRTNYPQWAASYFTPFWGQRVIGVQGRAQGREYVTWLLHQIKQSMADRGALPRDPRDAEMAGVPMTNRVLTMAKSVFTYALENGWISERQHPLRDERGRAGRRAGRTFELAYVPNRARSDLARPAGAGRGDPCRHLVRLPRVGAPARPGDRRAAGALLSASARPVGGGVVALHRRDQRPGAQARCFVARAWDGDCPQVGRRRARAAYLGADKANTQRALSRLRAAES